MSPSLLVNHSILSDVCRLQTPTFDQVSLARYSPIPVLCGTPIINWGLFHSATLLKPLNLTFLQIGVYVGFLVRNTYLFSSCGVWWSFQFPNLILQVGHFFLQNIVLLSLYMYQIHAENILLNISFKCTVDIGLGKHFSLSDCGKHQWMYVQNVTLNTTFFPKFPLSLLMCAKATS